MGKALEFGVKEGNGTEEAREALVKRLEDMSVIDARGRERIWGCARTHNVQRLDQELIVEEVKWILL